MAAAHEGDLLTGDDARVRLPAARLDIKRASAHRDAEGAQLGGRGWTRRHRRPGLRQARERRRHQCRLRLRVVDTHQQLALDGAVGANVGEAGLARAPRPTALAAAVASRAETHAANPVFGAQQVLDALAVARVLAGVGHDPLADRDRRVAGDALRVVGQLLRRLGGEVGAQLRQRGSLHAQPRVLAVPLLLEVRQAGGM